MENHIIFIFISLIIDYVLCLSLKKIFKLSCSKPSLLFLQTINLSVGVIYIVLGIKFYQLILIKVLSNFVICLLITDSYNLKNFFSLFVLNLALMFSYYGFFKFFTVFIKSLILQLSGKKVGALCDLITIIGLICYVFALFKIVHNLSKIKNLKTFLRKVSFLAFGKHIEIVGLLDSGNVLYDTKTKLPVVVLNVQTLKKYLPKNTYKNITIGDYSSINVSHYLKVVTVSNIETEIPIIEVDKMTICDGDKYRNKKCVLGIINHKFENANSYDCLLHRDFI